MHSLALEKWGIVQSYPAKMWKPAPEDAHAQRQECFPASKELMGLQQMCLQQRVTECWWFSSEGGWPYLAAGGM